jgi:hypothetical protein
VFISEGNPHLTSRFYRVELGPTLNSKKECVRTKIAATHKWVYKLILLTSLHLILQDFEDEE